MFEFPKEIETEYIILRLAISCQMGKKKEKNTKLFETGNLLSNKANEIKMYGLNNELLNYCDEIYPQLAIEGIKKGLIKENNDDNVYQMNKEDINFFKDLLSKDAQDKANEIMIKAKSLFYKGGFNSFNQFFYRFIKNLKGIDENDFADIIIKHFICSVCLTQYNDFKNNLETVMKNPHSFDLKILLFLLNFFEEKFTAALNDVLKIPNNIPDFFFQKVFTEEEISLYMVITILLNFNETIYKKVLTENTILVYKLNDSHPEIFEILNLYDNCEYEKVLSEIEKWKKEKFEKDPCLYLISDVIEKKIKINILKDILKICSAVDLKYLKTLLKYENEIELQNIIINIEDNDSNEIAMDDISGIIYCKKKNKISDSMDKCLKASQKNLSKIFDFIYKETLKGTTEISDHSNLEQVDFNDNLTIGKFGFYS